MNNSENELDSFLLKTSKLGLVLDSDFNEKIEQYCRLLREYNSHTNLVGKDDLMTLLNEHVLDSLTLIPLINELAIKHPKLIDIGSGAGFPGMILPLVNSSLQVSLVESVAKKCRFLELTIPALDLQDRISIHCDRAESVAREPNMRNSFHFATARAVSSLPVVTELCLPFLKKGGWFLAQRSDKQIESELPDSLKFITQLGGKVVRQHKIDCSVTGRNLQILVIEKEKDTPALYPRSPAQIKRSQL